MARKDVDLVIRAKDEAENVVKAITKALNEFNDAQKSTAGSADKTDSALGKLGAAFASLQKAVGGQSVGARIAAEMDRANAAVVRLEGSTAKTREELDRMKGEASAAESSLASLTTEVEKQAKAQSDQVKAIAKAKTELAALKLEVNTLEQATKGLVNQQTKLPETISKQEAAIAKTSTRLAELNAAYAAADKPGKTLTNQIAATNTRLAEQTGKLEALKKELSDVGIKLTTTGEDMAKLSDKAAKAEAALKGQTDNLATIKKNYSDVSAAARTAAQSQIAATSAVEKLTGKLANEEAQLETAKVGLTELGKAAGLSNEQLSKLTGEGVTRLESALTQQKAILAGAKEQYASLSQAASQLEADIGRAGVPTRKMSEDFATLKAQVAGSEAILNQARTTFMEMSQAFRTGEKDINGLEQIERQFVATQGEMSQAIQKATADYQRNLAAIKALHTEQAKGSGTTGFKAAPPVPVAPPVGPWNQLSEAFNKLYGDSRKSLSLTQRLRGEVLSLIAAYGGFYGVVNLLGQVLGAYQKLEAAQARLNVANGGNIAKSADDMDFLRRTADRLGVDLGTLAEEYSKFSIATQGTNLAGEKTRKIFLSVAEAARVNRSSTEEISGVFVALTQIVSKGAVQMEELRQQLGDRLPGALSIMADGLGVTTAELIKMMAAGQITSDALVPFAEELDRRFGPGLGEALAGTTVALGRLKNAAFQALVGFGKGGFIDAFTELANRLTKLLQSADFKTFIENISKAAAVLIGVLTTLVGNFKTFVAVLAGFAGLKLAPLLIGFAAGIKEITTATKAAISTQLAVRAAMGATGATAATAAVGMTAFRTALVGLLSSTGIGLAITAIAAGIGYWAASADDATSAMEKHKEIVDLVKNAYDETKGSVEGVRGAIGDLTVTEAKRSLEDLQKLATGTQAAFDKLGRTKIGVGGKVGAVTAFSGVADGQVNEVARLSKAFKDGTLDAKAFLKALDDNNQKFEDGSQAQKDYSDLVIATAKTLIDQTQAVKDAQNIVVGLTGALGPAGQALDDLAGGAKDTGEAMSQQAAAGVEEFNKRMEELQGFLPKTGADLKTFEGTVQGIQDAFEAALKAARNMPDAIMRIAAEQQALATANAAVIAAAQTEVDSNFGNMTDAVSGTAQLLRQLEGFQPTGKMDVNAFRAGFGSDTTTLSDGTIVKITEGMAVSVENANRDLIRRITTEFLPQARSDVGAAKFDALTTQQQAALTSLAYNFGKVPDAVAMAVKTGTAQDVAAAIRGLQGLNGGVNDNRRLQEAALFTSTAGIETQAAAQVKADEERAKLAEEKAKADKAAADATAQTIADGQFAIDQQTQINDGKERQAAIDAAIRAAKEKDKNITQDQIDLIAKQTGEVYDLAHAQEIANRPKEAAQKAEEAVNNLLSQRNSLQEQFNVAQQAGDTQGQAALLEQIKSVNAELIAAIDNAESMWRAIGGQEADTAIAKLEATKVAAQHFDEQAKQNYLDWSKVSGMIIDGLGSAFDSFSQKIADGMKPMQALRESFLQFASDFLVQIAQMIIKQAIFNALQSAFGGTSFGSLIGLKHSGGAVTQARGNMSRRVSPGVFAGAPRYHTGGVVGLKPGEVPIIAKEGERVLTEAEDKALGKALGGAGAPHAPDPKVKVINGIDSASFLEAALASPAGEKVILNWLRANSNAVSGSRG